MADPFLNGKPLKLCSGSDMVVCFVFFWGFYISLQFLQQHCVLPVLSAFGAASTEDHYSSRALIFEL